MTAPDPLDAADDQPQPTPDAVLDWIADRINARPWPIEGGYPVWMQGIDDGAADLDLLPADFDPEEDWEDPPAPVARYRITVSPREPDPAEKPDPTGLDRVRDAVARLIVSRLAHTHGLAPRTEEADRDR